MALGASDFDMRFVKDKRELTDAVMLPQRIKPLGPPPNQQQPGVAAQVGPMAYQRPAGAPGAEQQPMATQFAGLQGNMQVGPTNIGANANISPSGGFQGGNVNASTPVGGGQFDVGAALNNAAQLQLLQGRYSKGPFSASANYMPGQGTGVDLSYQNGPVNVSGGYNPGQGAYGNVGVTKQFQEGGLATSVHAPESYHDRDVDFINTRNQHMRELAGKIAYAGGGFAVR